MRSNLATASELVYFDVDASPSAEVDRDYISDWSLEIIRRGVEHAKRALARPAPVAPPVSLSALKERIAGYGVVMRAVSAYGNFPDSWDGQNSRIPSAEEANQALIALRLLLTGNIPVPRPMLLRDGTIGIYWRVGSLYASIDIEADGEHLWTAFDGYTYTSGTWIAGTPIPPQIRALFA